MLASSNAARSASARRRGRGGPPTRAPRGDERRPGGRARAGTNPASGSTPPPRPPRTSPRPGRRARARRGATGVARGRGAAGGRGGGGGVRLDDPRTRRIDGAEQRPMTSLARLLASARTPVVHEHSVPSGRSAASASSSTPSAGRTSSSAANRRGHPGGEGPRGIVVKDPSVPSSDAPLHASSSSIRSGASRARGSAPPHEAFDLPPL